MCVRATALVLGTSLFASFIGSDVRAGPRVALLPLGAGSETAPDLRGLEERLRVVVRGLLQDDMVTAAATQDLIESAAALGLRCHGADQGCLRKLAVLVELDQVLVPSVMLDGSGHHLHLALVDATSGTTRGALLHGVDAMGENLEQELVRFTGALLAPAQYTGTLVVQAEQEGATVRLDGMLMGETPLAPLHFVPVGEHLLVVSRGDEPTFAQTVTLAPGQELSVVVGHTATGGSLKERSLGFLSGLSLAAVGGTVAVTTALGAIGAESVLYSDVGEYHERAAVKNTGVVLLLTSAASTLTAAIGGGLLWWSTLPPEH